VKPLVRRRGLTLWYLRSSGRGGPICNDPLSIDIALPQLDSVVVSLHRLDAN